MTRDLGQAFATEVERLWTTLASNKRNIIPILDFLITKGLEEIHTEVCMRCWCRGCLYEVQGFRVWGLTPSWTSSPPRASRRSRPRCVGIEDAGFAV